MTARFRLRGWLLLAPMLLCGQAMAVDDQVIKDLEAQFATDPATAFDGAMQLFREKQAANDLNGMVACALLTAERGREVLYCAPGEDMIDVAAPQAEAAGAWYHLGRLYAARAEMAWRLPGRFGSRARFARFVGLADEALQRAGRTDGADMPHLLRRRPTDAEMSAEQDASVRLLREWGRAAYISAFDRLWQAVETGHDGDALSILEYLLQLAAEEPEARARGELLCWTAEYLWLRGAEALLRPIRQIASTVDGLNRDPHFTLALAKGATLGWSGHEDEFLEAARWCWVQAWPADRPEALVAGIEKLDLFGRKTERDRLTKAYVDIHLARPEPRLPDLYVGHAHATNLVRADTPADLRRQLVALEVGRRAHFADRAYFHGISGLCESMANVVSRAAAGDEAPWAYEIADELLKAALQFPEAEDQAMGAMKASEFYGLAGALPEADRTRALAEALAAGDPGVLLPISLAAAQTHAGEGKWEDVAITLEGPAARQDNTQETLQAALLLHEAYLRLGKPTEAETWIQKAWELVNSLPLTPGEKANYLMSMANLCDLAVQLADGKGGGH